MKLKIFFGILITLFLFTIDLLYLNVDMLEDKLVILAMFNFAVIGLAITHVFMVKELNILTSLLNDNHSFIYKLRERLWKSYEKISYLEKELEYYESKTLKCFDSECSGTLVPMSSINKKKCTDCKVEWDWNLDPGQKSTVIEGLNFDNSIKSKEELVSLGCKIEVSKDDQNDS